MSNEQISHLKEQLAALTPQQKLELAQFLTEQAWLDAATPAPEDGAAEHSVTTSKRAQHMAWLKANREQYAGQYVALDGVRLATVQPYVKPANRRSVKAWLGHSSCIFLRNTTRQQFDWEE
jgi:hypothetical protein